jgi:hypothetical protein
VNTEPERTPRWVKIFGLVSIVVIVLLAAALIFGGGQHGPARHLSPEPSTEIGR